MKAIYYETIKNGLLTISEIKEVRRWKNQVAENAVNAVPAVFIEFMPVPYDSDTAKKQSANNVEFVLHLVMEKYSTEDKYDTAIYELSQKIFKTLQRTDGIERLNEALDVTYDKLEDFQLTYVIGYLEDKDAMKQYTKEDRPAPDFTNEMNNPDGS